MPVVSNTSPILNLALIDRLSLIQEQFGKVSITQAVLKELRVEENLPGSKLMKNALESGWIQVEEVHDSPILRILNRDLDKGEAEAIALALELKAELILLDEREARIAAKNLELRITGVLGILLRAWHQKRIPSLQHELKMLRNEAGFRIANHLYDKILQNIKDMD
jgi:hypothetical protein